MYNYKWAMLFESMYYLQSVMILVVCIFNSDLLERYMDHMYVYPANCGTTRALVMYGKLKIGLGYTESHYSTTP